MLEKLLLTYILLQLLHDSFTQRRGDHRKLEARGNGLLSSAAVKRTQSGTSREEATKTNSSRSWICFNNCYKSKNSWLIVSLFWNMFLGHAPRKKKNPKKNLSWSKASQHRATSGGPGQGFITAGSARPREERQSWGLTDTERAEQENKNSFLFEYDENKRQEVFIKALKSARYVHKKKKTLLKVHSRRLYIDSVTGAKIIRILMFHLIKEKTLISKALFRCELNTSKLSVPSN